MAHTTLVLNGAWCFLRDPENVGVMQEWQRQPARIETDGVAMAVPGVWERVYPGYDGVGWYVRRFAVSGVARARARLRFHAVNYKAEVWLNGTHVGAHEGGYTPFVCDCTGVLQNGENVLVVRVVDVGATVIDGLQFAQTPSSKEGEQGNFGGIWQDVELLLSGPAFIAHVFVMPDVAARQVTLRYALDAATPRDFELCMTVTPCGADDGSGFTLTHALRAPRGQSEVTVTHAWRHFSLWSPAAPQLYALRTELRCNGRVMDARSDIFGMRAFTVQGTRFYLNGGECAVKGALHQGAYPLNLTYPESEEYARHEIMLAKEAGFNLLRLHIKPFHPMTLRLADELGMLLYIEPPIGWIAPSPQLQALCERELREMILRDCNHPAVVIIGVLNETGNPGFGKTGGCQEIRDGLCQYACALDPTRVIVDDSGSYEFTGRSGIIAPGSTVLQPTQDRHGYYRAPLTRKDYARIMHMGDPALMLFRSEYGTGGLPDVPAVVATYERVQPGYPGTLRGHYEKMLRMLTTGFAQQHLTPVFGTLSDFCRASQAVQADGVLYETQAMRLNPCVAGYIICQLADYPLETGGGVLDIWGNPKAALETLRQVNRPVQATMFVDPVCCYAGEPIHYELATVNEGAALPGCTLLVRLTTRAGQELARHTHALDVPHGMLGLDAPALRAAESGACDVRAELWQAAHMLAATTAPVMVLARRAAPCATVAVIDCSGRLSDYLHAQGVTPVPFDGQAAPVILIGDLEELDAPTYARVLAAYAMAARGACLVFLGIGNAKPMSPWYKTVTQDFYPKFFPENIQLLCAEGRVDNTFHYVKDHPLFAGLPVNTIINLEYRNVYPRNCLVNANPAGEVVSGCFHMAPPLWGVDTLLVRHGAGVVLYHQYDIIAWLGKDPAADYLLHNVLAFGEAHGRVTGDEPAGARAERLQRGTAFAAYLETDTHDWLTLGPFDNAANAGMPAVFEPEFKIARDTAYAVRGGTAPWTVLPAIRQHDYVLDLGTRYPGEQTCAYALTYFKATVHKAATLAVQSRNVRVWFNNEEVLTHNSYRELTEVRATIDIRRGWNKILVKSAEYSYDGTINNVVRVAILTADNQPFKDLSFSVDEVAAAEAEISALFLPPYLRS